MILRYYEVFYEEPTEYRCDVLREDGEVMLLAVSWHSKRAVREHLLRRCRQDGDFERTWREGIESICGDLEAPWRGE